MGKTYEALKRAEKEQEKYLLVPVKKTEKSIQPYVTGAGYIDSAPAWCNELWSRMKVRNKNGECQTTMISGVSDGCGSTTVAANLAVFLSSKMLHKVLLMEVNTKNPGLKNYFDSDKIFDNFDMFFNDTKINDKFKALNQNLVVITCDQYRERRSSIWLNSKNITNFFEQASNIFDYIIVDSAPIVKSHETRILASIVNEAILVLEAGKSRKLVAKRTKEEFKNAGVTIIGAVINKRKYHIPDWIYKRL